MRLLKELFDQVRPVCYWRAGLSKEEELGYISPISIDEMIRCLKRILESAVTWHKRGGRQGYLKFVSKYIV
jgi:hypothetical protein